MSLGADFEITQGDALPTWVSKLGDSRDASLPPLDLTGATVVFHVWDPVSGVKVTLAGSASVIAGSPATKAEYVVAAADFATVTPGDYFAKWRVTFAGGAIESFPSDRMIVRVFAAPPS